MHDKHSCPILERTADGDSVGRCWYFCPDDVCPRHGSVVVALESFRESGKLTDENDHVRWFPQTKPTKKPKNWFQRAINKVTGKNA